MQAFCDSGRLKLGSIKAVLLIMRLPKFRQLSVRLLKLHNGNTQQRAEKKGIPCL